MAAPDTSLGIDEAEERLFRNNLDLIGSQQSRPALRTVQRSLPKSAPYEPTYFKEQSVKDGN